MDRLRNVNPAKLIRSKTSEPIPAVSDFKDFVTESFFGFHFITAEIYTISSEMQIKVRFFRKFYEPFAGVMR